jgi:hypothetical protein
MPQLPPSEELRIKAGDLTRGLSKNISLGEVLRFEQVPDNNNPVQFKYQVTARPGPNPVFEVERSCVGERSSFYTSPCEAHQSSVFTVYYREQSKQWVAERELFVSVSSRSSSRTTTSQPFAPLPDDFVKQLLKKVKSALKTNND